MVFGHPFVTTVTPGVGICPGPDPFTCPTESSRSRFTPLETSTAPVPAPGVGAGVGIGVCRSEGCGAPDVGAPDRGVPAAVGVCPRGGGWVPDCSWEDTKPGRGVPVRPGVFTDATGAGAVADAGVAGVAAGVPTPAPITPG